MVAISCPKCSALISDTAQSCYQCGAVLGKTHSVDRRAEGWIKDIEWVRGTQFLFLVIYVFLVVITQRKLGSEEVSFWERWTPSEEVLKSFGAQFNQLVFQKGEWWRLVTSLFVHLTPIHLLFNTVALASLGQRSIERYGGAKSIVLFVATGIVGSAVTLYLEPPQSLGGGASGGICGLLGALLVASRVRRDNPNTTEFRSLVIWAIFIAIYGMVVANIGNYAHAGGFLAGLVLGKFFGGQAQHWVRGQNLMAAACLLTVIVSWAICCYHFDF